MIGNLPLRVFWLAAVIAATCGIVFGQLSGSVFVPGPHHPSIRYEDPAADAVAGLNQKLDRGELDLVRAGSLGYLEAVLGALDVPPESQMALFSRNSLQSRHIRPGNPRLIYFSDTVVVAGIRGAPLIEVAALDPEKGVIFYTLEQQNSSPRFSRQRAPCLRCHESLNSLGVPGMLVRSIMPSASGEPNPHLGNFLTDHTSPLEERWGGWYVTGEHGNARHLGNGVITDVRDETSIRDNQELTLASIRGLAADGTYLTPYSDVVALMVFEHQMHMTNLLVRYGWEIRYGLASNERNLELEDAVREVVDYMLFVDETALESPVVGSSGFREVFERRGPFDRRGRSLRQLDLETRLMRYPLSYMIYTEAFERLPDEGRNAIYRRIWQVLSGEDDDARYGRLSLEDRRAIVEILSETGVGVPDYYRSDF